MISVKPEFTNNLYGLQYEATLRSYQPYAPFYKCIDESNNYGFLYAGG